MNQIILIGRLTKDAESRTTATGKKTANFNLAVDDGKDASGVKQTQFFNCTAWERLADVIINFTNKGSQVAIIGSLKNRSWDKPDGSKAYATDVLVREVELLGKPKQTDGIGIDDVEVQAPF
jgi:single-strand DNA-binding protein